MATNNLPTIQELYEDVELKQKQNSLNILLNQQPAETWMKPHPTATKKVTVNGEKRDVPIMYLPIERVEWLLTRIFIQWKVEIKEVQMIANSVVVTVRLHYQDPLSSEWLWQDGIGAAPLQTAKDAGAIDWAQIKSAAVQMGAPAAESYAVKDAAEKIGKLFGKDMNRADQIAYGLITDFEKPEDKLEKATIKIIEALDDYQGDDKQEIITICKGKKESGEFDMIFAKQIANKINLKL